MNQILPRYTMKDTIFSSSCFPTRGLNLEYHYKERLVLLLDTLVNFVHPNLVPEFGIKNIIYKKMLVLVSEIFCPCLKTL